MADETPNVLKGQECPICRKKTLVLTESDKEIPYFGKVYIFSMTCESCKYHKADLESAEKRPAAKYTFEVNGKEDLNVRVVKSSEATVKIPHITTVTPGPASNGYVTNVEGVIKRVQAIIEGLKEHSEDESDRKKAKNMLKKIQKVLWGQETLKIIIEDPSGNSAIISDKAVKSKL
jgi:zinc finger protein